VADAILFLASPLSGFVTGTELRVDGGLLAAVAVAAPEKANTEKANTERPTQKKPTQKSKAINER